MAGFKKAQRKASKFKGSIQGPSGSGKTYSALAIMTSLVAITDPGKRIAVIDTENSAELYSPPFDFDVDDDFGVGTQVNYAPERLIEKMEAARTAGIYGGVIIDSATHFWKEQGGFTRMIDAICDAQRARGQKADSFAAWKQVDPKYRRLMTYIRQYPLHVILCIRAKQAYERSEEKGKGSLKKVGLEPEFREGFEYEMDAQFAIDQATMVALKHRLGEYLDGKTWNKPGEDVARLIATWLAAGAPGQDVTPPPAPLPSVAKAGVPEVQPAVSAADVEEPAPETSRSPETEPAIPAVPPTPPPVPEQTPCQAFLARILAATSQQELKSIATEVKAALKDKLLTTEEYNGELSPAYAKRLKAIKEAA